MKRLFGAALVGALLVPSVAHGATLRATAYGPVDLEDQVPYEVSGAGCAKTRVRVVVDAGAVVRGSVSRAGRDCRGVAGVPSFAQLTAAGWKAGTPIGVRLSSRVGAVPLRFQRLEVDAGTPASGKPSIGASGDDEASADDKAVTFSPGDAVDLGRVWLRGADSVALRLCITASVDTSAVPDLGPLYLPDHLEPSTFLSIRQDSPDGAPLVKNIDVASDPQELSRLSRLGFPGCYRLVSLPITGRVQEDAPKLFLKMETGLPGTLKVTSLDVNGLGAKVPREMPKDLPGMRTIFDGTSFAGWQQTSCRLRDGAAVNDRNGSDSRLDGCSMTFLKKLQNVVIRVQLRRENFYDNSGLYLGDQEIQTRSVGEYLPGGYFGQMAARWQKLATFPAYSIVEIVQLGARNVVSIDGRTVSDVMRKGGPPAPYLLTLVNQPFWSYRTGAEVGFGNEGFPDVTSLSDVGAFWYRQVKLLECSGPDDPVCRRAADAHRGEVPVPPGAPAPLRR